MFLSSENLFKGGVLFVEEREELLQLRFIWLTTVLAD
ncbi:MAG: hypothetical protein ACI8QF_004155, partial [Limisphaerales bacterium]